MKAIAYLIYLMLLGTAIAATNTLTVTVGQKTFTNVVSCVKHGMSPVDPGCWHIRYIANGKTNDFHAGAVRVTIITNTVPVPEIENFP